MIADFIFVISTIAFFLITIAYVYWCERLGDGS